MKSLKNVLLVSILISGFALVGCKEKGPLEKAGESVDNAAKKTGEALQDAGEATKDAAKDAVGK